MNPKASHESYQALLGPIQRPLCSQVYAILLGMLFPARCIEMGLSKIGKAKADLFRWIPMKANQEEYQEKEDQMHGFELASLLVAYKLHVSHGRSQISG